MKKFSYSSLVRWLLLSDLAAKLVKDILVIFGAGINYPKGVNVRIHT